MDKSWLNIRNRADQRYRDGVEEFLDWAFSQPQVNTEIRCPCKGCMNTAFKPRISVRGDLLRKGFWDSYKVWDLHGEVMIRVVVEQQSEDVQHPMSNDEILSSVLGEYVRGKGYAKKPPRKGQIQQADIEASVSSAMESMRQEMLVECEDLNQKLQDEREDMERKLRGEREDMERKLQEERDQMAANFQKKMEEERELMKIEVDKMLQEQMATIMTRMQQGHAIGTRGSTKKKN